MAKKVLKAPPSPPEGGDVAAKEAATKPAQEKVKETPPVKVEKETPPAKVEKETPPAKVEKETPPAKVEKETEIRKRLKTAFDDFPTSGKLYHDGNEVYFYQAKPQMTMVKRADFFNPTAKKE